MISNCTLGTAEAHGCLAGGASAHAIALQLVCCTAEAGSSASLLHGCAHGLHCNDGASSMADHTVPWLSYWPQLHAVLDTGGVRLTPARTHHPPAAPSAPMGQPESVHSGLSKGKAMTSLIEAESVSSITYAWSGGEMGGGGKVGDGVGGASVVR